MKPEPNVPLVRHLRSFVLPLVVAGLVPFLLVARLDPFRLTVEIPLPYVQIPVGVLLVVLGFVLLAATIRLFARVGRGTLAPWDPTRRLVTQGIYGHTRNPMIAGVFFILLGEAVLFGSWLIVIWSVFFLVVNTVYFKVSEEPGLMKRFGKEYLEYRAHVPMWIPRIRPWRLDNST